MQTDESLEKLRSAEPTWDDLREQRVLGRVVEAQRLRSARMRLARTMGAALAGVAVVLVLAASLWRPADPPSRIVATTPHSPESSGSSLALADGSEVALSAGAEVEIREQSEQRVVVDQGAGEARYDVRPNRARSFVVQLGRVEVVVVGTRFRLAWAGEWVRVHVEQGRVRVNDGERQVELAAGEELRVLAVREGEPEARTHEPEAPADADEAVAEPRLPRVRSAPSVPSVTALLAAADAARESERLGEAARALGQIAALHAADPRVPSALFTLGRVERSRGRHAAAASAFERCLQRAPRGPLAEDAMAEAAASWAAAGNQDKARAGAGRYLETFPGRSHTARMRRLVE